MTNKKHPDNFYLNVTHIGDRIFHKHYNSHTKQKTLDIIENFPIDLYVENNKKSNFKGLHGENLLTVSFDSLRDAREYIKNHSSKEIHGQEKFVYQFIRNEYPNKINFDITKFNIGNIDIETAFGVSPYHKEHIIKIRDKDTIVKVVSLIEFESTYNTSEYKVWDEEVGRYLNYQDTCYKASDGFPTPAKANQMITAITIKVFGERHKFITFGLTDYIEQHENTQYVKCKDEAQLLTKFLRVWQALDIDILTGFYIGGFDIPYLVNRINNVLGDNRANELSPLSKYTKRGLQACTLDGGKESYKILGITIYDYIDLFKKFAETNLSNYSLNAVAAHVLGEQKLDYSEMGNLMDLYNGIIPDKIINRVPRDNDSEVLKLGRHRAFLKDILDTEQDATIEKDYNEIDARIKQICLDTFYTYNVQDVRLVERLDDKQKLIMLALTLSFLTKAKQEDVFSPVRVWESLIYNELAKDGIAVPPKKHHHIDGKFAGAYVKEPIPGFYRWIMSTDLTSLYPMIMWQYNISPETQLTSATGNYVKEIVEGSFNTDFLLDNNSTMIANGATFTREFEGIIPRMVKTLFAERKRNKNEQLAIESKIESNKKSLSKEELDKLESIRLVKYVTQMGFKILLNALYGSTGNEHFRYFSLDIAEGITLTGQVTIKYIMNKTNDYLNDIFNTKDIDRVIMVDTDSLKNSIVKTSVGDILLEDLWQANNNKVLIRGDNNFVKAGDGISAFGVDSNNKECLRPISYLMKHKVKKQLFKIKVYDKNNKLHEIECTCDHSLMVMRNNIIISVKPAEILKTDEFILNSIDINNV